MSVAKIENSAKNQLLHPYSRIIILIAVVIATYISDSMAITVVFYFLFFLPLLLLKKLLFKHLKFLLIGILPIFLSYVLINIVVLEGKEGGWDAIFFKITKLTIYAGIFQFVLTIPAYDLYNTFKKWGFRGDTLILLLSSFTVWKEITNKADKIVTARLARGYQKNRNILVMARQLPFVLNPLIIGILRTSMERAESWGQKNIIVLAQNYNNTNIRYSNWYNMLLLFFCFAYLFFCLFFSHMNTFG